MQKWALSLPGTFSRLAPHTAALHALHSAYEKGLLESEPGFISTSSVAGIPASVYIQRSEEKLVELEEMEINLRRGDFVSLNPDLKKTAAIDFVSILALLVAAHGTGKIKNPILSYAALAALGIPAFQISKKAIKDIFSTESFLVYDNLYKLLMKTLDFDAIFNSPIKIEIPAVNLNKAGWTLDELLSDPPLYLHGWANKGWVSVTNFKPQDVNLDKDIRNANYVRKLINGLRVFGHFAPGRHDNNDAIVDTAALSNLPVHFALDQGYTNIVVLHYNSTAEAPTDKIFKSWPQHLSREFDICVSEMTRKAVVGYLRVNNDLSELAKQRENLKKLEGELYRQNQNIDSPGQQAIRQYIRDQEESQRKLSYAHKLRINFIFAGSDPLPNIHLGEFTQDEIIEGLNTGYKSGNDIIPSINKMIKAV